MSDDLYYPLKDLRELVRKGETDDALAAIDGMLAGMRRGFESEDQREIFELRR